MILFSAVKEFNINEDGSIRANYPELPHSQITLRKHISKNNGKRVNLPESPYISAAHTIEAPLIKYSYGPKREDIEGGYKPGRNETRARIFLFTFDEKELPEETDVTTTHEVGDHFYMEPESYLDILDSEHQNFTNADREAIIYGTIDAKNAYEVHPFLADVLFLLTDRLVDKDIYDGMIEKIISGEYSIDNFNKILDELIVNPVERKFIEDFYKNRQNIATSCEKALDMIDYPEDPSQRDDILVFYGTCLRNQIIADLFPQLMERDFRRTNTSQLKNLFIPIEDFIHMTAVSETKTNAFSYRRGSITIGDFTADRTEETSRVRRKIPIPYGMIFERDDNGNIVSIKTRAGEIVKYEKERPTVEREKTDEIWRDEAYKDRVYTSDDLSKPEARVPRIRYIRKNYSNREIRNDGLMFRIDPEDSSRMITFDEEGYCIICRNGRYGLEIIDFMRDESGQKTKFDDHGRGLDRQGYDISGMKYGLDEFGADKSGASEYGIPTGLTRKTIEKMDQEELDEYFRTSMDTYLSADRSELRFDTSPVERIINTYIGYNVRINADKRFIYNKMLEHFFGEDISKKDIFEISPDEVELVDKVIRSAMRVAPEYGLDVKQIIEGRIDQFIEDQIQHTQRAVTVRTEI